MLEVLDFQDNLLSRMSPRKCASCLSFLLWIIQMPLTNTLAFYYVLFVSTPVMTDHFLTLCFSSSQFNSTSNSKKGTLLLDCSNKIIENALGYEPKVEYRGEKRILSLWMWKRLVRTTKKSNPLCLLRNSKERRMYRQISAWRSYHHHLLTSRMYSIVYQPFWLIFPAWYSRAFDG